jgi:hypothetical protein
MTRCSEVLISRGFARVAAGKFALVDCPECGDLYDEAIREEADSPSRRCLVCQRLVAPRPAHPLARWPAFPALSTGEHE